MPLWPFSKKKAEDNNYDYDDSYDDDFEEDIVDEDLNTTSNTSRGGSTRHSHHATAGRSYNNGGDAPAEPTDSAPDTAPATSTSGAILGDEYDETPDPVHDAIDGDSGPFDGDSVNIDDFDFSDFSTGILNLGSMLIPLPFKSEVQVEMGADGPKMLHILTEHGRCTPVAFAAPARAGQWRETVKEITQGMRNDGLDVVVEYGPWGREVVGSAPGGGGICSHHRGGWPPLDATHDPRRPDRPRGRNGNTRPGNHRPNLRHARQRPHPGRLIPAGCAPRPARRPSAKRNGTPPKSRPGSSPGGRQ